MAFYLNAQLAQNIDPKKVYLDLNKPPTAILVKNQTSIDSKMRELKKNVLKGLAIGAGATFTAVVILAGAALAGLSTPILVGTAILVALIAGAFFTGILVYGVGKQDDIKSERIRIDDYKKIDRLPDFKDKPPQLEDYFRYQILMALNRVDLKDSNLTFSEENALILLKNGFPGAIDLVKKEVLKDPVFLEKAAIACPLLLNYKPNEFKEFRTDVFKILKIIVQNPKIPEICSNIPGVQLANKLINNNDSKRLKVEMSNFEKQNPSIAIITDEDFRQVLIKANFKENDIKKVQEQIKDSHEADSNRIHEQLNIPYPR